MSNSFVIDLGSCYTKVGTSTADQLEHSMSLVPSVYGIPTLQTSLTYPAGKGPIYALDAVR